jgi:hypothetical protein
LWELRLLELLLFFIVATGAIGGDTVDVGIEL